MRKIFTNFLVLILCFVSFQISSQCDIDGIVINSLLADPNGTNNFDTDGDGTAETSDEFVEFCNTSAVTVDMTGWTVEDDNGGPDYTFPSLSVIPGECIVLVRNWDPGSPPPGVFSMGSSAGWLNNGGDSMILSDGTNTCEVVYGTGTCVTTTCDDWGGDMDGCPDVLGTADCTYVPAALQTLPVEFSSFTASASGKSIALDWKTASEINNDYFEVQWSTDGDKFQTLDYVKAIEEFSRNGQYTFVHDTPIHGLNYYRLKQVDNNGAYSYSIIISQTMHAKKSISIHPTTILDYFVVEGDDLYQLDIYDLSGQRIHHQTDLNNNRVDLRSFTPGMYIVTLLSEGSRLTKRIIKL